jgi:nucleoside-diphosphate-sugar epimerase
LSWATRAATAFNGFYGFLRQLVQLRGMLERMQAGLAERTALRMRVDPDAGISIATVDAVAEEMVRIGPDDAEGVFHVTHPSPPAVGMVIRAMARAVGLREPTFAPNKAGFTWLDGRFDRRLDFYGAYLVGDKRFDRRRTDQVLGGRHAHDVTFDEPSIDSFARWYLVRLAQERRGLPAAR